MTILSSMETIYTYNDYRRYLADYYAEKKQTSRAFSFRSFASKADIKSPVFLKQVIDGERNLTASMLEKFIAALGLTDRESIFFRNLVRFNQAKTADEKQEFYAILLSMNDFVKEHRLTADQYRYFETWYTPVIRELITLAPFDGDFKKVGAMVIPPISAIQTEETVKLLERIGLLAKIDTGYVQTEQAITGGTDMMNLVRRKFNSTMIERAVFANNTISPEERYVSGITMGVSKGCYDMLVAEISQFRERVKTIVSGDRGSDRVYQFNVQLFPMSRAVHKEDENV